jgi:predicted enzyme related to lactoylglutathione lyase
MKLHAVAWVGIPVADMARASKFYSAILDTDIKPFEWNGEIYADLPFDRKAGGVGASLVQGDSLKPSYDGPHVFLDCNPDVTAVEARVASAGGKVLMPTTFGDQGWTYALIEDTEGNRIGLHSLRQT